MMEREWAVCVGPQPMLKFLCGKASDRKLRLFACGCCRRIWHLLTAIESRKAIEFAELYADGSADEAGRRVVREAACAAARELSQGGGDEATDMAASAACFAVEADEDFHTAPEGDEFTSGWGAAYCASQSLACAVQSLPTYLDRTKVIEETWQAALLRDIFGNPFRPISFSSAWKTRTAFSLAAGIYDERAFDRLPILADALEDAGCTDRDILDHCRGPGPHVRGCWVVDLLLGKR